MKILVYPKDPNPYQQLLYKNIKYNFQIKYLIPIKDFVIFGTLFFPIQLIYYRIKGYNIFHLHWTYHFVFPYNSLPTRVISTIWFIFIIYFIKILNYKLVWTVHNVLPGNKRFIFEERTRNILSNLCNAKIVHSESTIDEMKQLKIDTRNCFIIPHGTYEDFYINNISSYEARKYLNINHDYFVLLFFGRIEHYKGINTLIESFKQIIKNKSYSKIVLLIAGNCEDEKTINSLNKLKKENNNRIILHLKYILKEKVQYYFNSADLVVYPANRITTSGSLLLALSFFKPILYTNIGNLKDLPEDIGYKIDTSSHEGLTKQILEIYRNKEKLKNKSEFIKCFIEKNSWNNIAKKTIEVYKNITK